ncbi:MAG: hypothetical protein AAFY88_06475 [Acidobacteriota bacterium]
MPSFNLAIGHLERALELGADTHEVHYNLSVILSERGNRTMHRGDDPTADYRAATHHGAAAVELVPDSVAGLSHLAAAHARIAEYQVRTGVDPTASLDGGIAAATRASELEPDRVSAKSVLVVTSFLRGQWLEKTGRDGTPYFEETLLRAEAAAESFPGVFFPDFMGGQAHIELARIDARRGVDPAPRAAEAREWYARGLAKVDGLAGPQTEQAIRELVEARYALGTGGDPRPFARKALEHADLAVELDPARSDAVRLRGEAELVLAVDADRRGDARAGSLFERAHTSLDVARGVDLKDARNPLALASWAWHKAQSRLGASAEEVEAGLDAAREAQRLDGQQMEALALEGALLTLDPETRAEGAAKIRDAIAGNAHLSVKWGELAAAR